jgi:two-component system, NtrC family, sensor kinase
MQRRIAVLRTLAASLRVKVAFYLALGMIAALVVFMSLAVRQERHEFLEIAQSHVADISDMIVRSTHYFMLQNEAEYVHRIIENVARDKSIDRIRIFSKKGVIIDSTIPSEVGLTLDTDAEGCRTCHQSDRPPDRLAQGERARTFTATDGRRMLGSMQVIRNEASCGGAKCHVPPEQQPILGLVDVIYPLDSIERALRTSTWRMAGFSLGFVLLASLSVGLLVRRLIHRPLEDLEHGANRLATGDLRQPIPVRSGDEFGRVAASFNAMMTALDASQAQLRESARTLEQKVEERTHELRAAQAEAVQHGKLAAVGLLAAGIAHELNNPLTGVLTFSHLVRDTMPPGSPEAEDMDLVIRETKRCAAIIRRLLDFARQKQPERKLVDLNALAADVTRFVERSARLRNTAITMELAPDLPQLWIDEGQLKQVVMNMLVNAQHATERGGTITIRTRLPAEPIAPKPDAEPVKMVELSIIDTGCGIPEADLQRIFEPFFTSKEVGKGTGLGLSVSHGIVEAHGGTIRVESTVGAGSAFHVFLPLVPAPGTTRHEEAPK